MIQVPSFLRGMNNKLIVESSLPLILLLVTFTVSTLGPFWTLFSLSFIPIEINLISKYFKIKDSSTFYFAFTIYSIILSYVIFEYMTSIGFSSLTKPEYILNLTMLALSIYSIQQTRTRSWMVAIPIQPSSATTPAMGYNYCKKCIRTIPGRDHHCIWLNTCIGKSNRYWFLATIFFSIIWLLMTVLINLTSICYPVYLFGDSTSGWILVPFQCPDIYNHVEGKSIMATISFISSMYGIGVLFFLVLILIHQLRLLYKGMSYLEYKYGQQRNKSASVVH